MLRACVKTSSVQREWPPCSHFLPGLLSLEASVANGLCSVAVQTLAWVERQEQVHKGQASPATSLQTKGRAPLPASRGEGLGLQGRLLKGQQP